MSLIINTTAVIGADENPLLFVERPSEWQKKKKKSMFGRKF